MHGNLEQHGNMELCDNLEQHGAAELCDNLEQHGNMELCVITWNSMLTCMIT